MSSETDGAAQDVEVNSFESFVSPPLLLTPQNAERFGAFREGKRLSTRRVELRWRRSGARCEQPTFDVRVDDSCEAGKLESCPLASPEFAASCLGAETLSLEGKLPFRDTPPVGTRYFWQVRECCDGECSEWPRPRYFDLGRAKNDFNGDGLSDFTFEDSEYGVFKGDGDIQGYLYYGSPQGVKVTPRKVRYNCLRSGVKNDYGVNFHVFQGRKTSGRGGLEVVPVEQPLYEKGGVYGLYSVGDVNADGFDDLLLSSRSRNYVYLHPGGPQSILRKTRVTFAEDCVRLCESFEAVGDVNGDGFDDVFCHAARLGFGCSTTIVPEPFLLLGSRQGLTRENLDVQEYDLGTRAHGRLSVGDVDADGLPDHVFVRRDNLVLIRGRNAASSLEYEIPRRGEPPGRRDLSSSMIVGDLNGDGFDDNLVSFSFEQWEPYTVVFYAIVFYGGSEGFVSKTGRINRYPRRRSNRCGELTSEWMPVGDINGDGYDDLFLRMRFHDAVCDGDEA